MCLFHFFLCLLCDFEENKTEDQWYTIHCIFIFHKGMQVVHFFFHVHADIPK